MEEGHFKKYRKEADVIAEMMMDIYEDIYKSRTGNKAAARRVRNGLVSLSKKGVAFRRLSMKAMQNPYYEPIIKKEE